MKNEIILYLKGEENVQLAHEMCGSESYHEIEHSGYTMGSLEEFLEDVCIVTEIESILDANLCLDYLVEMGFSVNDVEMTVADEPCEIVWHDGMIVRDDEHYAEDMSDLFGDGYCYVEAEDKVYMICEEVV